VIGEVNYGNDVYGIVASVYHGDGKPVTYHYCLFAGGPEKPIGDLEEYATAAEARVAMDAKAREYEVPA
jgi:hypothetical protein